MVKCTRQRTCVHNFSSKKSSARSISLALTTCINKRCDLTNDFGAVTLQMILSRSTHIISGFENCSFSLQEKKPRMCHPRMSRLRHLH